MGIEDPTYPRRKAVNVEAGLKPCLNIGNGIGKAKGNFLHGRAARLTHMVTGHIYGIPQGHVFAAKFEDVCDEPDGRLGREDIGPPDRILFEDIVLYGPPELLR